MLNKLVIESKKLLDFTRCMSMATNYKINEFNYNKYYRILSKVEEAMNKEHTVLDKLISKSIKHYFNNVPVDKIIAKAYEELTDEEKVIIDDKINDYVKENIHGVKRDIQENSKVLQEAEATGKDI